MPCHRDWPLVHVPSATATPTAVAIHVNATPHRVHVISITSSRWARVSGCHSIGCPSFLKLNTGMRLFRLSAWVCKGCVFLSLR